MVKVWYFVKGLYLLVHAHLDALHAHIDDSKMSNYYKLYIRQILLQTADKKGQVFKDTVYRSSQVPSFVGCLM